MSKKNNILVWTSLMVLSLVVAGCKKTSGAANDSVNDSDSDDVAVEEQIHRLPDEIGEINELLLSLRNVREISANGYVITSDADDESFLINFNGDTIYSSHGYIRSANDRTDGIHVKNSEFFIDRTPSGYFFVFPMEDSVRVVKLKEKPHLEKYYYPEYPVGFWHKLTRDGNVLFGESDEPYTDMNDVMIIYDREGNPLCDWIGSINEVAEGRYIFRENYFSDSVILADVTGKQIGKDIYSGYVRPLKQTDTISVQKGELWGAVDPNGKCIIPFDYESSLEFNDGYAITKKDGKWGAVDIKGKWTSLADYDEVNPFSNGMAAVSKNGEWGYINTGLELVIEPFYERADPFRSDLAYVEKNGRGLYITKDNKVWHELSKDQEPCENPDMPLNTPFHIAAYKDGRTRLELINTKDRQFAGVPNFTKGIYLQGNDTVMISTDYIPRTNGEEISSSARIKNNGYVDIKSFNNIYFLPDIKRLLGEIDDHYLYIDYNGNIGYKNIQVIKDELLARATDHIDQTKLKDEVIESLRNILNQKGYEDAVIIPSSFKLIDNKHGIIDVALTKVSSSVNHEFFRMTGKILETSVTQDITYEVPFTIDGKGRFGEVGETRIKRVQTR